MLLSGKVLDFQRTISFFLYDCGKYLNYYINFEVSSEELNRYQERESQQTETRNFLSTLDANMN